MYFLSDAYLLRAAIIAERREEREAREKAGLSAPTPAKPEPKSRPSLFSAEIFRLPALSPFGRTK